MASPGGYNVHDGVVNNVTGDNDSSTYNAEVTQHKNKGPVVNMNFGSQMRSPVSARAISEPELDDVPEENLAATHEDARRIEKAFEDAMKSFKANGLERLNPPSDDS